MDAGVIVPHLLPQNLKCQYRNIELEENNLRTMMWKVLDQCGQESIYNEWTFLYALYALKVKFNISKDVLPGAILCRFVALLGSVDDQVEEVWVFRHPEHGIGQVSVAKTVAHETLLEDWWKLLHTKEISIKPVKKSLKIL